jgi:hypothetical protein
MKVATAGGRLNRFSSPNRLSSAHPATLTMSGAASIAIANVLSNPSVMFRAACVMRPLRLPAAGSQLSIVRSKMRPQAVTNVGR